MTRDKKSYRLPEDTIARLEAISKARGKTYTDTIIDLINNAEATDTPRYQWLDDACPLLYPLTEQEAPKQGEGFYCLERSPKATKLGSGIDTAAEKYCEACQFKKGVLKQNELLTKQIKDGFTVRIPFCSNGGKLTPNLKSIYCPKQGENRSIEYCTNSRCEHLSWIHAEAQRPQTSPKNSKTGR